MKRLITLILTIAGFTSYAQVQLHSTSPLPPGMGKVGNTVLKPKKATENLGSYFLDYEGYDEFFFGQIQSFVKVGFNSLDTTTGVIRQAMEVFDTLLVTQDYNDFQPMEWGGNTFVRIDTLYIIVGQQNNTGDTAVFKMRLNTYKSNSNANGAYLSLTNELWADSIAIDTNLTPDPDGSGFPIKTLKFTPGVITNQKFAATFEYFGDPQDTCYLRFSYGTDGSNCGSSSQALIIPSELYPQSFYSVALGGEPGNPTPSIFIPRISGNFGYYWYNDCDNSGDPYNTPGDQSSGFSSSENSYQNWSIWASVTLIDSVTAMNELSNKEFSVSAYPNPAKEVVNLSYQVKSEGSVNLHVHNILGTEVLAAELGHKGLGKNTYSMDISGLPNGIYTYTMEMNGKAVTRKFVVAH
ncbi:MAG: T9SS type A sorting domain-containing protein [Bacteroidia bacterium]|nr:T9SS type A sorting domain-containing protein [Bacteroidia bacterium]